MHDGNIPYATSAARVATTWASETQSADVVLPRRLAWTYMLTWQLTFRWQLVRGSVRGTVAAGQVRGLGVRWQGGRANHWCKRYGIPSQSLARFKEASRKGTWRKQIGGSSCIMLAYEGCLPKPIIGNKVSRWELCKD
nr:hypothetical protein [Tanacetum cinerariifolium]